MIFFLELLWECVSSFSALREIKDKPLTAKSSITQNHTNKPINAAQWRGNRLFIYFGLFINGLPLSHIHTTDTEEACHRQMMHLSDFSKDHSSVFHTPKKIIYTFLSSFYFKRAGRSHWEMENQNCGWRFNLMPCTKLSLSPQTNILCIHTPETMQWNDH